MSENTTTARERIDEFRCQVDDVIDASPEQIDLLLVLAAVSEPDAAGPPDRRSELAGRGCAGDGHRGAAAERWRQRRPGKERLMAVRTDHALDVIRGELEPLPERLADQLARETDPQRIAHALQVAHGEALGRIVGRLEAMDDQARGEQAEAAPCTSVD